MRIHYSSQVRVRLTASGQKNAPYGYAVSPEGDITISLWALMGHFGPGLRHGQEQPFLPYIEVVAEYDPINDDPYRS